MSQRDSFSTVEPVEAPNGQLPPSTSSPSKPPALTSNEKQAASAPAPNDKPILVKWDGQDDPANPFNWSLTYRWFLTIFMGILTLNSSFTSSLPSGTVRECMEWFHVSEEVMALAISMYVVGFAVGPIFWAPMSEIVGRYPTFVISLTGYTAFNLGCALCRNIGSLIVFRLLAGAFAACPLTNAGAVLGDIWDANTRGTAMALFALAPFAGPALGPTISGAISVSHTYWRWVYYVATMFSGVCAIMATLVVKETHGPTLIIRKARRLRKETGDQRYKAPSELKQFKPSELVRGALLKPFKMLVEEPMLMAITLYTSFIYGLLYSLFEAFPLIFGGIYGMSALMVGLCFLPFFVGGSIACFMYVFVINPKYKRDLAKSGQGFLPPESRLPVSFTGGPAIVIACFWVGWTTYHSISFWCPLIGTSFLGFGFIVVFISLFSYMMDAYLLNSASAFAANTILRSFVGAGFPLFSTQMYRRLTIHWGFTLIGLLALVLAPVPFVLYIYGPSLRARSKNTMSMAQVIAIMKAGGGVEEEKEEEINPETFVNAGEAPLETGNDQAQDQTQAAEDYRTTTKQA